MSTIRMGLVCVVVVGLMSIYALANEPMESKNPVKAIEVAEKKALEPANEEALAKLLKAPAGAFAPEYDKKGVLLRLKIKGEDAVSTSLRGPRAERLARERAERLAKADFVKFLKEKVSVQENDREETVIVEKDGEEQAGYKSVSTKTIEIRADGLLRGLIVLVDHFEGEGRDRKAVVVYGWSKKLADAARTAQSEMAREPNPVVGPASGDKGRSSGSSGTKTRAADNLVDF